MDLDRLYESWGGLTRGQIKYFFLHGVCDVLGTFQNMGIVFVMGVPEHRCIIPHKERTPVYNESFVPSNTSSIGVQLQQYVDECTVLENVTSDTRDVQWMVKEVKCNEWVYDHSVYGNTLVSEMDIVCDRKMERAHAKMTFMLGYMVGVFLFGMLSDRFGRKLVLYTCTVLQLTFSIIQCFSVSFVMFLTIRVLTGFAVGGNYSTIYVLTMEILAPRYRATLGISTNFHWTFGLIILDGLAYFIRNWRHLQMVISFPFLPLLLYWCVLVESPRLLLIKGRVKEAKKVLKKIAPRKLDLHDLEVCVSRDNAKKGGLRDLVFNKQLCLRMVVVAINWMVVSSLFYGLSFNAGNLGSNVYLHFLLNAVIEIPSLLLSIALLNRVGRKCFYCATMILGGVACVGTIFPLLYDPKSLQWLTLVFAVAGKFGASAAFAVVYVFTAELFPTVVRNAAMGTSSVWARVGAIISPYIVELGNIIEGDFGKAFPLLVFGSAAIVASLLVILPPETANARLLDSVDQVKAKVDSRVEEDPNNPMDLIGQQQLLELNVDDTTK